MLPKNYRLIPGSDDSSICGAVIASLSTFIQLLDIYNPLELPLGLYAMAIYPSNSAPMQQNAPMNSPPQAVNIEAWTEQAAQSLSAVSLLSPSHVHGTSVSLAIDLDENAPRKQDSNAEDKPPIDRPRREPLRRDSLKRREALLKGKEGSRRRTRWENGSYHTPMA